MDKYEVFEQVCEIVDKALNDLNGRDFDWVIGGIKELIEEFNN